MRNPILIFLVISMLVSSCASERYSQGRSKPEIIETGYNLIRAKLNKLGVLDKVEVLMDSNRCSHSKSKNYHGSWFNELFDIGDEEERIDFTYILKAVGKPHFNSWERFYLNSPQNIFEVKVEEWWRNDVPYRCLETIPDTALNRIWVNDYFLQSLRPDFVPMQLEEALAIARKTFDLDTTLPCLNAYPYYKKLKPENDKETPIWQIRFSLIHTDTLCFYNFQESGVSLQKTIEYITERRKAYGQFYYYFHDYILSVGIHAIDKRVISASIYYTTHTGMGLDLPPIQLLSVEKDYRSRKRKWYEENADYLKSLYSLEVFNNLWYLR